MHHASPRAAGRAAIDRARRHGLGLYGLAAMLALAAGAACGTAPAKVADVVVIGATLPLTGGDSSHASAMKRGYERAIRDANTAGGVRVGQATLMVRLDLRDDTSDAAALETLAQSLIESGAHVIIATPRDVRAMTEAIVTENAAVPLVGNPIDHPGLPGKRMQWMVVVAATSPDAETRAHDVVAATIAAITRAGSLDPRAIRTALQSPPAER